MRDNDIDALFAQARKAMPDPDATLLRKIEDQALAVQAGFRAAPSVAPRQGLFGRWIAALGGGVAAAGLASAVLAGVWIGVAQPAPVAAVTSGISAALGQAEGSDYVELIPGFDDLAAEG